MDKTTQTEKRTLVEEGTELKGTLKSSCQVVVNGAIDGQIEAPALTVTETGTVLGTVKAEKLRSEGTLAGDIDASDVYLSGTVRSNTMIRAKSLEVKLAPERGKLEVTFGECLVEVGEDPAERHDATEPAADEPAAAQPAADAEPAAAEPAPSLAATDSTSADDGEPTWSEPPAPAEDDAGKRSKKKRRNDNRESQAPPA